MSYDKCPRCGEYGWAVEKCPCKPFWCYLEESDAADSSNATCVYAENAEGAAKRFAEQMIYYDSTYSNGGDVWVEDVSSEKLLHYAITVEPMPVVSAALVKDGAAEKQQ